MPAAKGEPGAGARSPVPFPSSSETVLSLAFVDILTTNANDNTVSLLLGNGTGDLAPAPGSPFAAGIHPYDGLQCIDVNADDASDIVVPNLEGNTVTVLL